MQRLSVLLACLAVAAPACAGYDANGVPLGAPEQAVIQQFPSAHCRPLQWTSRAADRRCDDARVVFAGVQASITFYLKSAVVQAFDVRFESRNAPKVAAFLKSRYGAPVAETRDKLGLDEKNPHDIYKVRWEQELDRAVLTAHMDRRRASLSVSRGNFEEEIYRVR